MIPSSLAACVLFALLVVPGLLYESVRARSGTIPQRSTFEAISSIAVAGFLHTTVASGIVAVASLIVPSSWFADARIWAELGDKYWPANPQKVLVTLATVAVLSNAMAVWSARKTLSSDPPWVVDWVLGVRTITTVSAWTWALSPDSVDHQVAVTVRTKQGELLSGVVLSFDQNEANQPVSGLALGTPMSRGGVPVTDCEMLLVPYDQIEYVTVRVTPRAA